MSIHPTAVVDPGAELHETVTVGPYAVIDKGVRIGADSVVSPHAVVTGATTIGARTTIGPFATIGAPPQDLKYHNEETRVVIGDDNQIREYVSIHRGTPGGRGITTVGNGNLLMAYTHVAHDCTLGDHVIMANAATLGGHVEVGDRVIIGGLTAVHQFSRIGEYAYIGGMSGISKDVPPYVITAGIRNQLRVTGINRIGLRRAGFSADSIKRLMNAYRIIFRTPELLLQDALVKALDEGADCEPVARLVNFFKASKRSVIRQAGDDEE
ncbi:MAG: acyl-ACP--UDP-N-acetylglucosamine O-acyltransferase [Thermodesulfobacteriota bacterium]